MKSRVTDVPDGEEDAFNVSRVRTYNAAFA